MNSIDMSLKDKALKEALNDETKRLAAAASRPSLVESIMRVRALGEIDAALDTQALMELALTLNCDRTEAAGDSLQDRA